MKFFYFLMAILFAIMIVCSPAISRAADTAPQTPLDQDTQAVSQEPQDEEVENTADGTPELYLPEKTYQFENVPAGQTVTHDFVVHNKGTALLHITRVKTG